MIVDTHVRPAGVADADSLDWLQGMVRATAVDMRGGPRWLEETPAIGDWATALSDPSTLVLVGTVEQVVVGMLIARVDDRVATVQLAFVHPEARELGLGDELLAAAVDHARHRGCVVFEGVALPGDRDTKNLYERAGITARKIVVSTTL